MNLLCIQRNALYKLITLILSLMSNHIFFISSGFFVSAKVSIERNLPLSYNNYVTIMFAYFCFFCISIELDNANFAKILISTTWLHQMAWGTQNFVGMWKKNVYIIVRFFPNFKFVLLSLLSARQNGAMDTFALSTLQITKVNDLHVFFLE